MSLIESMGDGARQLSPIWIAFLVIVTTRAFSRFVVRAWAWYRDRAWLGAWRSFGAVFRLTPAELWLIAVLTSAVIGVLGVWAAELARPTGCAAAKVCTAVAPHPYAARITDPLNAAVSGAGALMPGMPVGMAGWWPVIGELWPLLLAVGWALLVILPAWLADRRRHAWLATGRGITAPARES